MKREEVVKFFQEEMKRLIEEEHVIDLFKANCAEELAAIECRTTKAVVEYLDNNAIVLTDEEIQEGGCAALALWMTSSFAGNDYLIEDVDSFAHRLAREAGGYGKNIAYQMLYFETDLYEIAEKDFFSDEYARDYEEEYGNDTD